MMYGQKTKQGNDVWSKTLSRAMMYGQKTLPRAMMYCPKNKLGQCMVTNPPQGKKATPGQLCMVKNATLGQLCIIKNNTPGQWCMVKNTSQGNDVWSKNTPGQWCMVKNNTPGQWCMVKNHPRAMAPWVKSAWPVSKVFLFKIPTPIKIFTLFQCFISLPGPPSQPKETQMVTLDNNACRSVVAQLGMYTISKVLYIGIIKLIPTVTVSKWQNNNTCNDTFYDDINKDRASLTQKWMIFLVIKCMFCFSFLHHLENYGSWILLYCMLSIPTGQKLHHRAIF